MGELILVLGGARSGKSAYAQRLAEELGGRQVLFVATAEARDDEMRARIQIHQRERPDGWRTIEAPMQVGRALTDAMPGACVVLLDCITLLVSNIMLAQGESPEPAEVERGVMDEMRAIIAWAKERETTLIAVSNEVGQGLVPPYPLGRMYRDLLGRANCLFAAQADRVYMMFAGLPVELKALMAGHSSAGLERG